MSDDIVISEPIVKYQYGSITTHLVRFHIRIIDMVKIG